MKPENEVVEGADVLIGSDVVIPEIVEANADAYAARLPEPTGNITADIRTLFNAVFGNNG